MKMKLTQALILACVAGALILPPAVRAHCDTMDGPVILDAKAALAKKEVTPVLKWLRESDEPEIKAAFTRTLAVRAKGPEARELADQFFFETLVRVHRAGEGAPFTGLKPAGTQVEPAIREADKALETGSAGTLLKLTTQHLTEGIQQRFDVAREKKAHAAHSVEAGREFVAAYVAYVHYVEGLHKAAQGAAAHHAEGAEAGHTQEAPQQPDAHDQR